MRTLLRHVPQLQRLAVFEAVARLGTFTSAGSELGISQPAVSKQIANLEDQLQIVLFDRSTGRPRLTTDGARLHEAVGSSFGDLEVALAELRSGLDVLTMAVQPAVAENWFAPRMSEIQEALAPARLHVVVFEHNHDLETMAHDVSIRFGDGMIQHQRSMKLAVEVATPAASPAYAKEMGLGPDSDPTELLECELLEHDQTGRNWASWAGYFNKLDVPWRRPDEHLVYRTHASVVAQALAGRGVILTWRKVRAELFNQDMLVECGPTMTVPDLGHHLVWPPALSRDPGFRRLRDWLTTSGITTEAHEIA